MKPIVPASVLIGAFKPDSSGIFSINRGKYSTAIGGKEI
jgi:hypothetical protein